MIIAQIFGGLGNQMFQYAAARRLAQQRNAVLQLDISSFEHYPLRQYELSHFKLDQNFASASELQPYHSHILRYRIPRVVEKLALPYYRRRIFSEQIKYRFDPNFLRVPTNVYLSGYFQNQDYFAPISDLIRADFQLAVPASMASQAIAVAIEAGNSISLHLRRGDYASDPATRAHHGLLPLSYYQAAVQNVVERVSQPEFFVFSDDPDWAQTNLHLKYPVTFVTANGAERAYEDLWLLSRCKHHIIANSSFSWWGAWLSTTLSKIVYAPDRWILSDAGSASGVVPPNWNRLAVRE